MRNKKKILIFYSIEFFIIAAALLYSFQSFSMVNGDDGRNEYYPVFVYCGKYIREVLKGFLRGQFSLPQFDFVVGMGEGIIPVLNYEGFGDPFMLISAITPVKYTAYAYTVAILLKMYASGFGFIYYCKKRNIDESGILLGLPFYLANNYVFYFGFQYPPYQSVLISLPYICAGLDEVIQEKENKKSISIVLIVAVAYQTLYGFYLLYMELLFAAVYALVQLLCNIGFHKILFYKIGSLFGHIALGIMTGGIFFIPNVVGYFQSFRSTSEGISWEVLMQLEDGKYWEAFSSLVTPINYSAVEMVIPILVIIAVILAMIKKSKYKDLKIVMLILVLAYIKMRLTSYIMGGFTVDLYLNRWIFCAVFLISVLAGLGAEWLFKSSKTGWIVYGVGEAIYFLLLLLMEKSQDISRMEMARHRAWYIYLIMVVISSLLLFFIKKYKERWIKKVTMACMMFFIVLNIYTLFGISGTYGVGAKWSFETYESIRNEFLSSNAQLYNISEGEFRRKDIKGNSINESLYMGHYGTREYYSILNGNIYNFYKEFAITSGLNGSTYILTGLDSRSEIEDLLAVQYYDDVKSNVIVNNEDCLPIGFTFEQYYLEEEAEKISPIEKNANILNAVILDKAVEGIEKAELNDDLWAEEDFDVEYIDVEFDDLTIKVKSDSKILLTIDSKSGGECYFYAGRLQLKGGVTPNVIYFDENECELRNSTAQNLIKEHPALVCLGTIEKGKTTFEISFAENAEYAWEDIHVYTIDTNKIKEMNQERRAEILENVISENNKISGTIESSQNQLLFFSVPYSNGWRAYVDGEKADILRADYGFMAIALSEGYHEVELKYFTPGLRIGIIVSILGVFMIALLYVVKGKKYS